MLGIIASFLFCWFFVNCIHEGSHLFMGYLDHGLKPKGFYPFPHWINDYNNDWRMWRPWELFNKPRGYDRFVFAGYVAEGRWPTGKHELLHIAPLISAGAYVIVGGIFAVASGSIFSVILACMFLVDALVWVWGYWFGSPFSDGKRFRYGLKGQP